MMKPSAVLTSWAVVVLLLTAALGGRAQQPTTSDAQSWTSTIRGTVIRSDTREPVAGVSVNLSGAPPVTTDAEGRFSFERVRPGRYTVYSHPAGFLVRGDPNQSVTIVVAEPATPDEVHLVLTPFASISGAVRDPEGQPIPLATVDLRRLSYEQGRFIMRGTVHARTDDRGRYRLSGLEPGEYFVRATPPARRSERSGEEGWVRTYFPSTADPAAAIPIPVTGGAHLADHDITIQAVPMYAVSGTIENQLPGEQQRAFGGRMARARSFYVSRVDTPIEDDLELYENVGLPAVDDPGNRDPNHAFALRGLPSGVYDLYPIIHGVVHPADRAIGLYAYTKRTRVTVDDRDLTNVRAVVRRGHDVTVREVSQGRLSEFTDATAALRLAERRVWLTPREPVVELVSRENWRGVPSDGRETFVVPSVADGHYDVWLGTGSSSPFTGGYPLAAGEYLADIRQNGASAIDSGVTIAEGAPGVIEIVFESGAAVLEGTVRRRDDGARDPSVDLLTVQLLPRASGSRRWLYSRSVFASAAGVYSFANVAPGDYLVLACDVGTGCQTSQWDLDAAVGDLAPYVHPITVERGARLSLPPLDVFDPAAVPPPSAVPPRPSPRSDLPPVARRRTDPPGAGTITGTVVVEGTSVPADGIDVALARVVTGNGLSYLETAPRQRARTGPDGRFTFLNVEPGAYGISAHDGSEALPTSRSSGRVQLDSGQRADAGTLSIIRGGVIAGRLLDATGRPQEAARVQPLRVEYVGGRRTFAWVETRQGSVRTDDRGDFRIFGLFPGRYYLAATPPASWFERSDALTPHVAASSFFPGVRSARDAQPIDVVGGRETRADVRLHAAPTFTVSGRVTTAGGLDAPVSSPAFYLIPSGDSAGGPASAGEFGYPSGFLSVAAAEFTLREVPSGAYDLVVWDRSDLIARVPIVVDDDDVTGVHAEIAPYPVVTMRVMVDGAPAGATPRVRRAQPMPSIRGSNPVVEALGGGVFTFMALEGRYHFDASPYSMSAYVADIRRRGVSVLEEGVVARGTDPEPIDVFIETGGGRVSGTVTDVAGRPAAGLTVVLAPDADRRRFGALHRTAETDSAGRFVMNGCAPGTYTVFVMTDDDIREHERLADMTQRPPHAQRVTVTPRSFQDVRLPLD